MGSLATKSTELWPKVKLGTLGQIIRGNGIKRSETTDKGLPCLRYGEIYTSYNVILDRPRSFVPKEVFDRSLHISKGDLVFTLTGETEDEIAKTLAYLGDDEIAAGGDLAVWKNHGCDPKFLAYLMYTPDLIKAKALASNGQIIVHISVKKFQEIEIPLPPLPVQREIVARLEKELASVDRMVKGFEAMKAEADQLFKAELKESFEDIKRRGAETRRLGEVCDCKKGPFGSALTKSMFIPKGVDTIKVYEQKNAIRKDFTLGTYYITQEYFRSKMRSFEVRAGDIIVSCAGTIGETYILPAGADKGIINQALMRIRTADNLDKSYFLYYFETILANVTDSSNGSAMKNIPPFKVFKAYDVPLPPLTTQREIVAKLDAVREKCAKLKTAAEEGIKTAVLMRKAILKEAFE